MVSRGRGLRLALATVVVAAVGLPVFAAQTSVPPVRPQGLDLVISQGLDEIEVAATGLVSAAIPKPDAPVLANPEAPIPAAELIVAFHDGRGAPLDLFGFPGVGVDFFEGSATRDVAGRGSSASFAGRVSFPLVTERTVRVPLPKAAVYLVLALAYRTGAGEDPASSPSSLSLSSVPRGPRPICDRLPCISCSVRAAPRRAYEIAALAVYSLAGLPGVSAPAAATTTVRLHSGISDFPFIDVRSSCVRVLSDWPPPCPFTDGFFHSTSTLHAGTAATPGRFDIVILGDGFRLADLPLLDAWAGRLKTNLLATVPYSEFASEINISLVRTVSTDAGVTNCPATGARTTYYAVAGEWKDVTGVAGPPGYFGTPAMCRVRGAVEKVLPWSDVDLVVMIPNCDVYGGRADPWNRMIYLPADSTSGEFERLALHEAGHSVAWLGEEYVACATPDPAYPFPKFFPNVAPKSLGSGVWWNTLLRADGSESKGSGGFLAVHDCGDDFLPDAAGDFCIPDLKGSATPEMLGLYWGAMYGDATGTPNQCWVNCGTDATGATIGAASCDYYRPMARCRMRMLDAPYCRACEHKIRLGIRTRIGP